MVEYAVQYLVYKHECECFRRLGQYELWVIYDLPTVGTHGLPVVQRPVDG